MQYFRRWADPLRLSKKTNKMNHEESNIQINCVRWFRMQYHHLAPLLFAVPNGGSRNAREATIMKAEGVTAGVADLILLTARGGYGALCIEMKAEQGTQSPAQKEWQKQAEMGGNRYEVCRSVDDFMKAIKNYL